MPQHKRKLAAPQPPRNLLFIYESIIPSGIQRTQVVRKVNICCRSALDMALYYEKSKFCQSVVRDDEKQEKSTKSCLVWPSRDTTLGHCRHR